MKELSVLLLFLHRAAYGADEIDNEQRILIALNILQNQCLLLDADVRKGVGNIFLRTSFMEDC